MISVVGGTGRLGRQVSASLVGQGVPVRVVSRHAGGSRGSTDADPWLADAELLTADVADARQAEAAVAGASHVVAAMTGMDPRHGAGPGAVDRDAAIVLIDAAAEAGCHLVLVSVVGVAIDSPIELFRMKAAAEAHLRATDMSWTIIRATAFVELWADIVTTSAGRDGRPRLLGPARSPMNFVRVGEVAAAVVRATRDDALTGRCVSVGGPDNLSLTDFAARATGRAPHHVPASLVRALGWGARPFAPGFARIARQALAMEHVDLTFDGGVGGGLSDGPTLDAPRPAT
ncbi:MAG: NAD(P)H-binding protein [Nostocoides sp.]